MKRIVGNKKFVVAVLLVLAVGIALLAYKYITKDKATPIDQVNIIKEESEFLDEMKQYEQVLSAFQGKKWQETITLAKAYAANDTNDLTLRLTALNTCMRAANELKDTAANDDCFNQAKTLADTLKNDDDKAGWLQNLEKTHTNATANTEDDSGPQ